ncbi:MFS transporter [Pseudonocardia acaciae]|uniref:MFS transporter n=1 Tax=Pseudonocardia acaciae TaxID=551276 RepID=UPI00048F82F8|nr:MFS transporter [Pseudonocardia acaciae]
MDAATSGTAQIRLSPGRQSGLIVALGFAMAAFSVSLTMLVPLIPTLERQLGVSVATATLIVTMPLLSAVVAVPVMAAWGEAGDRRRVLLVAFAALGAGSLVAALAPNVPVLLVGQAIRGIGAGAFPNVLSALRHECDDVHRRVGVGTISGCNFLGQGLGGVIAGLLLLQAAGFRVVFWFSLAAALAALVVVRLAVPAARARARYVPDVLGTLTLGGALVCAQFFLTYGHDWGWTSAGTLGLVAATAALVLWWVAVERRAANPVVDLAMLRIPIVWRGNTGGFVAGIALFGAAAGVSTFVQLPHPASGLELGVLGSALVVLPLDLMMLIGAPLVGYLARYTSPRRMLVIGPVVMAAAFGVLEGVHTTLLSITVLMACVGLGTALTFASIGILFTEEVPPAQTGPALGFNFIISLVGGAFSGAILGAVLSAHESASGVPATGGFMVFWGIGIAAALAAALIMGVRRPDTRGD